MNKEVELGIEEKEELGRLLVETPNLKPDNWSWGKFFQVVRDTRVIPVESHPNMLMRHYEQQFRSLFARNGAYIAPIREGSVTYWGLRYANNPDFAHPLCELDEGILTAVELGNTYVNSIEPEINGRN